MPKEKNPNINSDYMSINRVAMLLDVSDHTIRRWYKWWDNDAFEKPENLYLPPYYFKDRRKTKFFKKEDIPYLKEFRNKLQTTDRGVMASFNAAYQWGKRGGAILEKKGTSAKEIQFKMK